MSLRCCSIVRLLAQWSPERALLTFEESGGGKESNWCSSEAISCENGGYRGLLINLRVMITTYIKEEYIGDGRHLLLALQRAASIGLPSQAAIC